jgi:transcriptional regulator with XRE-family HTH domain
MSARPPSPLIARGLEAAEQRLGADQLAKRLGVSQRAIAAWRLGNATMPESKFLKLVKILTQLGIPWPEWETKD